MGGRFHSINIEDIIIIIKWSRHLLLLVLELDSITSIKENWVSGQTDHNDETSKNLFFFFSHVTSHAENWYRLKAELWSISSWLLKWNLPQVFSNSSKCNDHFNFNSEVEYCALLGKTSMYCKGKQCVTSTNLNQTSEELDSRPLLSLSPSSLSL
jgi:hypothetical protein